METFITELPGVLAILPGILIVMTNHFKVFVPQKLRFLVPYTIGVICAIGLWTVFNDQAIGIYIIN